MGTARSALPVAPETLIDPLTSQPSSVSPAARSELDLTRLAETFRARLLNARSRRRASQPTRIPVQRSRPPRRSRARANFAPATSFGLAFEEGRTARATAH